MSFLNASLTKAFVISDLVLSIMPLALSAYLLNPPVKAPDNQARLEFLNLLP